MNTVHGTITAQDASWLLRDKYNGVKNDEYENDIKRLIDGEPLGYVIGWVPFLGLKINLDSKPLIPRPETEWWVEKMIEGLSKKHNSTTLSVLDMCSGSGAIGCSVLSLLPNSHVTFSDLDINYEDTVSENITKNDLDISRADIFTGDLFEPVKDKKFDVIASNPPYIPSNRDLPGSVIDYEPSTALYAGEDGLEIIKTIAKTARKHLNPNGVIWLEIDTSHESKAKQLFVDAGFDTNVYCDIYNRPRIIIAK